ncbi:hypothetical protein CYLTODRAFT_205125 [Cylindrobasidium torrendii FP15055 ss-10]|uniref:Uncharacterized protein n=1 Tax=Cylindrobasidium torrendii FP15055 ss-10 TaxID=1314674 RepID=A0A0D7AWW3_9AGAR|nr:hypothetical protein CYLTODRAFT_205125 [Cylindrobasidium torrendii FP15055 ss-10]
MLASYLRGILRPVRKNGVHGCIQCCQANSSRKCKAIYTTLHLPLGLSANDYKDTRRRGEVLSSPDVCRAIVERWERLDPKPQKTIVFTHTTGQAIQLANAFRSRPQRNSRDKKPHTSIIQPDDEHGFEPFRRAAAGVDIFLTARREYRDDLKQANCVVVAQALTVEEDDFLDMVAVGSYNNTESKDKKSTALLLVDSAPASDGDCQDTLQRRLGLPLDRPIASAAGRSLVADTRNELDLTKEDALRVWIMNTLSRLSRQTHGFDRWVQLSDKWVLYLGRDGFIKARLLPLLPGESKSTLDRSLQVSSYTHSLDIIQTSPPPVEQRRFLIRDMYTLSHTLKTWIKGRIRDTTATKRWVTDKMHAEQIRTLRLLWPWEREDQPLLEPPTSKQYKMAKRRHTQAYVVEALTLEEEQTAAAWAEAEAKGDRWHTPIRPGYMSPHDLTHWMSASQAANVIMQIRFGSPEELWFPELVKKELGRTVANAITVWRLQEWQRLGKRRSRQRTKEIKKGIVKKAPLLKAIEGIQRDREMATKQGVQEV